MFAADRGLRIGDWKLLSNPDGKSIELYDLATDIGETNNLAGDHPDRVTALLKSLLGWYGELPLAQEN